MTLVTIPTLEGEPIDDVANTIYRAWGVGQKGKNEGIMLLLAVNDRRRRLEIGYGLEPILQTARTNYQLGAAYASCAKPEEAAKKFRLAAAASAPDQMLWAWRAAKKLPGFDGKQWQGRLQTALAQAKSRSDTSSYTSWWDYTAGALAGALAGAFRPRFT